MTTAADNPEVSIVVPAYNEEGNIEPLCLQLAPILEEACASWEILLCDDGSTDGTWERIRALTAAEPRIRGVRLSRNFGHQYAIVAGMHRARGQAVVSMDADLQHPPVVVAELIARWRAGAKVVKTVREGVQHESWLKGLASDVFYRVFSRLSGVGLEPGMADFRLLDRQVVDALAEFEEEGLFLRGIVEWVGYESAVVPFQVAPRASGTSKYSWWKMLRFAWHGVSSFSVVPLRMGIELGLLSSVIAFVSVIYAIVSKWGLGEAVPGWTSSVAITSFLFGVLFVYLGLLGEYIGRILVESRRRPRYLVSETAGVERESS